MEDTIYIIEYYSDFIQEFIYYIAGVYIIIIAFSYIFVFLFPVQFDNYISTY